MMSNRAQLIVLACLAGCSSSSLKDAVKHHLIDPDSAQIRNITYSDAGNFACVEVYAKDRQRVFHRTEDYYQKTKGKWAYASNFAETHDECVELINTLDRNARQKRNNVG